MDEQPRNPGRRQPDRSPVPDAKVNGKQAQCRQELPGRPQMASGKREGRPGTDLAELLQGAGGGGAPLPGGASWSEVAGTGAQRLRDRSKRDPGPVNSWDD